MGGLIPPSPTSPSFSLSKGEGAVLQIFNEHHNYHIGFISQLSTFGRSDNYRQLRKARALKPHPSFPSPKKKELCCIANPNLISTTSALYLWSSFSESLIIIGVFEKPGLCFDGLLFRRRSGGGTLLIISEESDNYQYLRKAWAVKPHPSYPFSKGEGTVLHY